MIYLAVRLGEMDFAERVGRVALGFGETVLTAVGALGPAGAIGEAEVGVAAQSGYGGVGSVDGDADLPVRLRASDGARGGILIVDFASPERGSEEDESDAEYEEKEAE